VIAGRPAPHSIGHYTNLRKLGAGGMGEVYLAEDTKLGRKVAVKILPEELARDEEAKRRLLREARSAAAIDHPNVCTIYEVGEEGERPFVIMQYIEGETLAERISRAPLSLAECVDIGSQVASGIQEAHSRGVIHRDIKPLNIMITSRGQVKVLDFGLAKPFMSDAEGLTELQISRQGMIAGTTPYMSPEQLRGEPLDGRSDIFSLGVVLYEMAAGKRPFDRGSAAGTITAILTDPPPPLTARELAPLQRVIDRCLSKERERRYQDAAELLEALRAINSGRRRSSPSQRGKEATVRLVPRSDSGRRRATTRRRRTDPEVVQLTLRGRLQWNRRYPDAIRQGIVLFQQAIERDPSYAPAYAGLADCYLMLAFLEALPPNEVVERARAAAMRAIQLDRALAEPHASLGYLSGFFEWDLNTAEAELREAIRLEESYAWAPHWLGILIVARGRFEESIELTKRARTLDPLSPIIATAVGIPYHFSRRYDEAATHYQRVLEMEPNFAPAHYYIGLTYEQRRQFEQAQEHLLKSAEITGRVGLFLAALGHCYGLSGRSDDARAALNELHNQTAQRYVSPYNLLIVHIGLGEVEQAYRSLEQALQEHSAWLHLLPVDPRFDPLRAESRFRELVARYGLAASLPQLDR
jgi:serine/threonine-protein kinase